MKITIICLVLCIAVVYGGNDIRCPPTPAPWLCNGGHEWCGCGSFCDVECGKIGEDCPIQNIKCTDRCYCDPGYARDEFCNCVPFDKCDNWKCNGGNEHYACGSHCDEECGRLNQTCPIINIKCVDRCYCNEGYARDNRCKCVPKEYCNSC
ncbi:inducible metalloproteinase inhibitor protein-like [Ctenocephalides felis]|uniref:inducible metalloproteinase inhibitor protein-like n=1 Tax=Ctenocephalides felis TaxID=7515 RepID=UPI000E6E4540|nr:inducible metalloproteinase inhibitor protein-like [Ctenocephalides felis]